MRTLVALALALAAGLAGCLQETATPDDVTRLADAGPDGTATLDLVGTDCQEGGGHSVHPVSLNPLPAPWMPADILDDVGPQLAYSEIPDPMHPVPEKGYTMGNYHATMTCTTWTFRGEEKPGLVFGYVGMKVQTPSFAEAGPTHEYLVTVVATSDPEVNEALHEAGFHPMKASASETAMPGDWLRIQMSTDHNGEYDSLFKPAAFGDMKATHVRLWFQKPAGECSGHTCEGPYQPLALDLFTTTPGEHFVAQGQGYFSHTGTDHHDPLPGAYGHTAGILYRGFDRTFRWGPAPLGVALDEAYVH